jgi:dinuclear metal center YbgI/SA1388 family protein
MTVQTVIDALEVIAPLRYAAEWDNVGLLLGSPSWPADSILLTIDLTEDVLAEALAAKVQMIVAYHPPIFEPLRRVTDATVKEHIVLEAARAGIAIYSQHTALDATPGGIDDWLAEGVMGLADHQHYADSPTADVRALSPYQALPQSEQCKVVTFCPADAVDAIRNGLATAGAGRIGNYELCSFALRGQGTFFGGEQTKPTVGGKGTLERVDEVRLEMVCSESALGLAVIALREFHPYEEPPIEIYRLLPRPERHIGQGRRVRLDRPVDMPTLVERIKQRLGVARIRVALGRNAPDEFRTIGLSAGAGGSLIDSAIGQGCEAFFTGEMRHHDILAAQDRGCTVILAGHTNTERGYLNVLRERLSEMLPKTRIDLSQADRDPLAAH